MRISEIQSQLAYLKQCYGDIDVVACTSGPLEPDFYQAINRIEVEDFSTDDDEHHAVILRLSQD